MAFLRSIYINLYILGLIALTIKAVFAYSDGFNPSWLGVLLTTIPILALIGGLMIFQNRPRTSANLYPFLALAVAGAALTGYAYYTGSGPILAFSLAIAALLALVLFIFWYSRLKRGGSTIRQGAPLPPFKLGTDCGRETSSEQFLGKPTIFLFFRGNWCPLCMAQVKEVAEQYKSIVERGATVALISPQSFKHTLSLVEKFDVPLKFYVDRDLSAAKALGIVAEFGTPMGLQAMGYDTDTVLPTVVITDEHGKVVFFDETDNYRVRPEPQTFITVLDKMGVEKVA